MITVHECHGRKWRTVAQWKDCGGVDGQTWCTDLEWYDVLHDVWHPDAFMTYQEEMRRPVPVSITKLHIQAWINLCPAHEVSLVSRCCSVCHCSLDPMMLTCK